VFPCHIYLVTSYSSFLPSLVAAPSHCTPHTPNHYPDTLQAWIETTILPLNHPTVVQRVVNLCLRNCERPYWISSAEAYSVLSDVAANRSLWSVVRLQTKYTNCSIVDYTQLVLVWLCQGRINKCGDPVRKKIVGTTHRIKMNPTYCKTTTFSHLCTWETCAYSSAYFD